MDKNKAMSLIKQHQEREMEFCILSTTNSDSYICSKCLFKKPKLSYNEHGIQAKDETCSENIMKIPYNNLIGIDIVKLHDIIITYTYKAVKIEIAIHRGVTGID